jgi:uncharacterized protein YecT (DUF1311 family)
MMFGCASLLVGCSNKPQAIECDSSDSKTVVTEIVSDQIKKETKSQAGDFEKNITDLDSRIRATVSQLKITINDIRTSKIDPNSTKRFCEATLSVVIPLSMINDADRANEFFEVPMATARIKSAGFERNADRLTHNISYSVQPTDDGSKTFAEVENADGIFKALGEVISSHLLLPIIDAQQQSKAADDLATEEQISQQKKAELQAELDLASAENKLANQAINEVWKTIPDDTRAQLIEVQRAWIAKKEASCNIKAAETSTDELIKETARLRCDTDMTQIRFRELRNLVAS